MNQLHPPSGITSPRAGWTFQSNNPNATHRETGNNLPPYKHSNRLAPPSRRGTLLHSTDQMRLKKPPSLSRKHHTLRV